MAQPVVMYSKTHCPYCVAAKRFFEQQGIEHTEIDVTHDPEKRRWLVDRTGQLTVPQIFIGETSVGGYTDLRALHQRGGLEPLLNR